MFEQRIDAVKLCLFSKRTFCIADDNIGTWQDIIRAVSKVACICNVAMMCISFDVFEDLFKNKENANRNKLLAFILMEHLFLMLKWLIDQAIPDMPSIVKENNIHHQAVLMKYEKMMENEDQSKLLHGKFEIQKGN